MIDVFKHYKQGSCGQLHSAATMWSDGLDRRELRAVTHSVYGLADGRRNSGHITNPEYGIVVFNIPLDTL